LAARGQSNRIFPWGEAYDASLVADNLDNPYVLNPITDLQGGCTPEGIVNLAGNAAEWVLDDACARGDWPLGASTCSNQSGQGVLRGGSFLSDPGQVRTTARRFADVSSRVDTNGFRCATSLRPIDDTLESLLSTLGLREPLPVVQIEWNGNYDVGRLIVSLPDVDEAVSASPVTIFPADGQAVPTPSSVTNRAFLLEERISGRMAPFVLLLTEQDANVWGMNPETGQLFRWTVPLR